MNRSAVTILLSLFLACLGYQLFIYYKPYLPIFDTDSFELWTVIIACALVPVAAILLIVASITQPKSSTRRRQSKADQLPKLTRQEEKLCRQLIEMLNGDQNAAHGLFSQSKQANPNKDVMWHLDKVLYDLERDRAIRPNAPSPHTPKRRRQPLPLPQQTAVKFSRDEERAYRELVNLLHGDVNQANRLFRHSLEINPLRGVKWNIDKVTLDLIRDRSR